MLKTSKRNRFKTAAMAAALASVALVPLSAHAAGLGRITVLSSLGQPLKAELEVTANKDELNSLAAKLAPAEAFRVAGIEYASALSTLRFSREVKERGGKRYVEITTDRPVNEPFIDMLVELNWASGRLVREYTFLLDPPELAQKAPPPAVATPDARPTEPIESLPIQSAVQAPVARPVPPVRLTAPVEARPKPTVVEAVPAAKKPAPVATQTQAAPAAAGAPAKAASREVKSGDTLGKIANDVRPDGVSLDQMLVALFRSNPDAFNGNMNRMSSGKILNVPDAEAIRSIDASDARREVLAQSADFNAYRRKLADAAASGTAGAGAGGRASSGKITAKVEDKIPPVASGKDKLEVSRTEATPATKLDPKAAGKAPLEGRLSALEEDLASRERALRDASSRIAQLEKNLTDLKKLAELKSEAGATLQKQAGTAKPASPPPMDKPAPAPAKAAPPAVEPPKPAVVAAAEAPKPIPPAPVVPVTPVAPATPAASDPPKPAEPPAPPPPPPPPKKKVIIPEPEPEPDFLEENGPLVFGGAGVIALLLGYLGFSAYRRKKQAAVADVDAPVSEPSTHSVFSETTAESIDASVLVSGDLSVSDSIPDAAGGAVDPLVEADTYLAFGRDAQAEEILLEALKAEPTRHAIHVKLLEIYSARRSTMQFNTLARDLRDQTGGQGADWARALALGVALDPANALYQTAAEILPLEASVDDTLIAEADELAAAPIDPEATMILAEPVMLEEPAPIPESAVPAAPAVEEVASFDFDLDLGEPVTAETEAVVETAAAAPADNVLDFDLDLGEPESEQAPADNALTAAASESAAAPAADSVMALDIDFDLDTPEPATESATELLAAAEPVVNVMAIDVESAPEATAEDQTNALDIDFDLDAPSLPAEPESVASAIELPTVQIADIEAPPADNAIDFALDIDLPAVAESTEAALSLPEIAPVAEPPASADTSIDFDFDLGEADTNAVAATEPEPEPVALASTPMLDLGAISLDLDTPADTPLQDLAAMDFDLDAPAVDGETSLEPTVEEAMPDNPEAATKLELAIAYEEMGDRDGARELLEEVVKEGSPVQVAAAQAKLDTLG